MNTLIYILALIGLLFVLGVAAILLLHCLRAGDQAFCNHEVVDSPTINGITTKRCRNCDKQLK